MCSNLFYDCSIKVFKEKLNEIEKRYIYWLLTYYFVLEKKNK